MTFSHVTPLASPPVPGKRHVAARPAWQVLLLSAAVAAWTLAAAAPAAALAPQGEAAPAAHAAGQPPGEPPQEPPTTHTPAVGHEPEGEAHDEHEAESPWSLIGRIFNFLVLAGSMVYLLRSPAAAYLRDRSDGIRADLRNAEESRVAAARQMRDIEARMQALPGEITALTERGKREMAAEEARILQAAEAERTRMLEQARREIDLQVRNAERMLRRRAGELAVDVASARVSRTITDADQARLLDRYLDRVGDRGTGHGASVG